MAHKIEDIELIIHASRIPIELPYPFDDRDAGASWFIKQPTPWLLDMAGAINQVRKAEILNLRDMRELAHLPPSQDFIDLQTGEIDKAKRRMDELEENEFKTPLEELELLAVRHRWIVLIRPENYSLAKEIADKTSNKAYLQFLIERLVVDEDNKPLFDQDTADGRARLTMLGDTDRSQIINRISYALDLVELAKNYKPGQSSS